MKKRILIQGALAIVATAAVIVFHNSLFPKTAGVGEEVGDILGMFLVLNGFWLRSMARGYKSLCSQQSHALVTQGIYRLTRNPMYFGTLMIGAGATLAVLDWKMFLVFLVAFLAIYLPEMRKEEKWLTDHFGEPYLEYCRRTPKFFPKLTGFFHADFWKELRCEWIWFWAELRAMVITVVAVVLIEVWQDIRISGQGDALKEVLEFLILLICILVFWAAIIARQTKIKNV